MRAHSGEAPNAATIARMSSTSSSASSAPDSAASATTTSGAGGSGRAKSRSSSRRWAITPRTRGSSAGGSSAAGASGPEWWPDRRQAQRPLQVEAVRAARVLAERGVADSRCGGGRPVAGAGITFGSAGSAVPGVPARLRGAVGSASGAIVAEVIRRESTRAGRPSQAPWITRSSLPGARLSTPSRAGAIQSSGGPPGRGSVRRSGSAVPDRIRRSQARVMAT